MDQLWATNGRLTARSDCKKRTRITGVQNMTVNIFEKIGLLVCSLVQNVAAYISVQDGNTQINIFEGDAN